MGGGGGRFSFESGRGGRKKNRDCDEVLIFKSKEGNCAQKKSAFVVGKKE